MRAFANFHPFSIDGDFEFVPRRSGRNFRSGRTGYRNQRRGCLKLLAHEKRLHRSIAERIAPEAVCPKPQIEASRIACAISFSRALSCSFEPSGLRCARRCNASSWRIVPTRHGTHWPHVSLRKNAAMRRRIRSEEHTSELQSRLHLVCRLLLEKKKKSYAHSHPLQLTTTRRRRLNHPLRWPTI